MKKIYAIEGLGGEVGAWLRTPLREAGFEVVWYPWWWSPKIPAGSNVFSHSFGAGKAIKLVQRGLLKPRLFVTLDARMEPRGGFKVPKVEGMMFYNFFQLRGLQGCSIEGAINQYVPDARHGSLPSHRWVINLAKDLVV
jgi:hypothetical protein